MEEEKSTLERLIDLYESEIQKNGEINFNEIDILRMANITTAIAMHIPWSTVAVQLAYSVRSMLSFVPELMAEMKKQAKKEAALSSMKKDIELMNLWMSENRKQQVINGGRSTNG